MVDLTLFQKIAIWAVPILFAITLHEVAHGWVASKFGDQTARLAGRLTVNPIAHIDLIGTIIVPLLMLLTTSFIFGWAKPVPVDPRNMKNPRLHMALTALAGPLSNILQAVFWAAFAKLGFMLAQSEFSTLSMPLISMGYAGIMINIVLGVLNLIPLPPLDGGNIVVNLLPKRAAYQYSLIEPYGFLILILLLVSGLLVKIMAPFVFALVSIIASLFGLG